MDKRRFFFVLLSVSCFFFILVYKLFSIQILHAESYSARKVNLVKQAVAQRGINYELDSGRGDFYDRNLRRLTGDAYPSLLIFPDRSRAAEVQLSALRDIVQISEQHWHDLLENLKSPQFVIEANTQKPIRLSKHQADQIRTLNAPGAIIVDYRNRYPIPFYADHLLGYIGENPQRMQTEFASQLNKGQLFANSQIGGAGLEKTFQPYLQGIGATSISLFSGGGNTVMKGLDYRRIAPDNPFYPLKIVTTLDLGIQEQLEQYVDQVHFREGAVVVLDAATADVIAMISRPQFNPNAIDLNQDGWSNRALKAIVPGSVFKTVVAAAALDEHVVQPNETFECHGELGKYEFSCWKKGGHGTLTLAEAFAQSCNITFAKVMQRLDSTQLEDYARKLGLMRKIGWEGSVGGKSDFDQLDAEEAGQVFAAATPKADDGVRVQTAIGQRDVRMTPLQAANLVVSLLNRGEVKAPRVVKEIRYQTDRLLAELSPQVLVARKQGISAATSQTILHWMEDVVEHGTGTALKTAKWKLAGKSGTAQMMSGKKPSLNEWFIGFGPVNHPRYAVAVVSENRPDSQSSEAVAIFRGVMDRLASISAG